MIVYLVPNDYYVNREDELCNKIDGHSFILFTTTSCHYCKDIQPIFVKMSQTIQGCTFGIIDVDQENQKIVNIASRSKTPLEYVPYMILYLKGRPIAQFIADESHPEKNFDYMRDFLIQQSNAAKRDISTMQQHRQQQQQQQGAVGTNNIPAYSLGIPGNLKNPRARNVCYLGFDKAYGSSKQS